MKLTQEEIDKALNQLEVTEIHLGAWGMIAEKYMEENAPMSTSRMKMKGTFLQTMKQREEQAKKFMADTTEALLKKDPVKREWSYLEQVAHQDQIQHQAWEMTLNEILCPPISEQDEKNHDRVGGHPL